MAGFGRGWTAPNRSTGILRADRFATVEPIRLGQGGCRPLLHGTECRATLRLLHRTECDGTLRRTQAARRVGVTWGAKIA